MLKNLSPHLKALLQALLVTFLWSTSFVLIKIGLEDIPPLTFAGLRYSLAFLILLPFAARSEHIATFGKLSARRWALLIALGLLFYAVTQGAQFLGLDYLPATSVSLLLNFTSVIVALMSIALLAEQPTLLQWGGMLLFLAGAVTFFYPISLPTSQIVGYVVVLAGVLANAGSSILGRHVNRERTLSPIAVTVVSMGIGAIALLATGILTQGVPRLSLLNWTFIGWLAVVNTAFAFTLWNHTLRTLTATESSIINGTMLVQIAILAWLFLGERLDWREVMGMGMAGLGAIVVQLRR